MSNASVERYKKLLSRLPPKVKAAALASLVKNADKITSGMKATVPRDKGKLAESIRMEVDATSIAVTIRAGGPLTTRPVRQGADASYDYALAQEFGTEDTPANPFFWPTYRLFRKSMRSSVKRAMSKAFKEEAGSGN